MTDGTPRHRGMDEGPDLDRRDWRKDLYGPEHAVDGWQLGGQCVATDRMPVHRDRDEFREEPRGEQRATDGWDFLGGLALLVSLFGGSYALDVWIRRWPEAAPFIAVLGAVAMVAVIGGLLRWMDRASRARQGMTRRQELISARAWTFDVVGTVALAMASIPYLALFIRQDNWTDLGAAVACLLTSGLWLRKVLRLRGHRVPDPRRRRPGAAGSEGPR